MKHKMILLVWLALLSFCSVVVGVMALLGYANAEVIFWTNTPIESESGKIIWVSISAICLISVLVLSVQEYRKKNDRPKN